MPIDDYDGSHGTVYDEVIDAFAEEDAAVVTGPLPDEDRPGVSATIRTLREGLGVLDARVVTMIAGRVFSLTSSNPYRPLVYLVRVWRGKRRS